MKTFILIMAFSMTGLFASFSMTDVVGADAETTISVPTLTYQNAGHTMVHRLNSEYFIHLMSEEQLVLPSPIRLVDVTDTEVKLKSVESGQIHTYTVGDELFGLAIISGENYDVALVNNTEQGYEIDGDNADEVFARACGCRAAGTPDDGCKSGGEGSKSCTHSSSGGGSVAGTGGSRSTSCSVSCQDGYYSCCAKPPPSDEEGELQLPEVIDEGEDGFEVMEINRN